MAVKKVIDKIRQSEDFRELRSSNIRAFLDGSILTKKFIRKQYVLLILIVALGIVYIDNRYASEKQITRISELKKQIQDSKYESLTVSAQLMEISRQSNIVLMLEKRGMKLKQGNRPPVVVE